MSIFFQVAVMLQVAEEIIKAVDVAEAAVS